ncbi:MAG: leucine--tRNA ligase [Pirellulaceae bacterium]|nr:leucine--tRNA ligase [Pirellulaceae bacterium]
MPRYNPAIIEPKWQNFWDRQQTFRCPDLPSDRKLYVLDMFPYPSGDGLHVGHPEGYTATDIVARYARMCGKTVLHPMGYDAFGLPAEEHAIKTNTPPRVSTEANIATFTRQLKMLGFSYDWNRVLATTDREYFRWTQWIFLILFDTWYDRDQQKGRPISELPIPDAITKQRSDAVRRYQDKHRLAYQDDALVNWCPALGTVLANEEVIDGRSEVGNHPVQRIPLRQWMLRITSYGDRLLSDLESLDWSPGIKKLQADWIGRSTGAEVDFFVGSDTEFRDWNSDRQTAGWPSDANAKVLRVYTTRPDTLYGATYMVIAPEHPLAKSLTTDSQRTPVEAYCQAASFKSDRERSEGDKQKTGVFTGSYAINPVNGQKIPIWIADYVLAGYGTGAIMAVPAHDQRDFEFAVTFGLPIVQVVEPPMGVDIDRVALQAGKLCFVGLGTAVASGSITGLDTDVAKDSMIQWLTQHALGVEAVNYKLRDWLFSRQRFWGEPFPILHELDESGKPNGLMRTVPDDQLPVDLPQLEDYKPHGRPEPPLAKADASWLYVTIDGKRYRRETNTMPQWAGSCWYYLRFIDPRNNAAMVDPEKEKAWMPIDLYVGGAEHAVLHLLYSRFWHKVLYDRGYVSTKEPFQKLVNQGMILGDVEFTGLQDSSDQWVSFELGVKNDKGELVHAKSLVPLKTIKVLEHQVNKQGDLFFLNDLDGIRIDSRANKMSKSRGNVVNPDEIVKEYGADALRLYEMFMGPLEATKPWSMNGVSGVRNFLDRVWRLVIDSSAETNVILPFIQSVPPTTEQNRMVHATVAAVTRDLDAMSFNTAIARMMEFVNFFTKEKVRPQSSIETIVLLLAPFAPHMAEELWEALGHSKTLAYEPWPSFDEKALISDTVEVPVQVNGKLRSKVVVSANCGQAELEQAARGDKVISELLAGKQIVKSIVVPGRMVNFVVR